MSDVSKELKALQETVKELNNKLELLSAEVLTKLTDMQTALANVPAKRTASKSATSAPPPSDGTHKLPNQYFKAVWFEESQMEEGDERPLTDAVAQMTIEYEGETMSLTEYVQRNPDLKKKIEVKKDEQARIAVEATCLHTAMNKEQKEVIKKMKDEHNARVTNGGDELEVESTTSTPKKAPTKLVKKAPTKPIKKATKKAD